MDRRGGRLAAWTAAWFVVWIAFTASTSLADLSAGVVVAAAAAWLSEAARVSEGLRFRPDARWFALGLRLPKQVVADSWTVTTALARHLAGRQPVRSGFVAVPLVPDDADRGRATARRTLITWAVTLTPNTTAVDTDEQRGLLLVHQLVPSEDPAADLSPFTGGPR